ncbi:hypothetical protein F4677DRAFT_462410 [Hypoxylon crocopeplum]|nr:hypothetical protein F4677DRAFT_462410 [Hypoxylon crocopeplum]
MFPDGTAMEAIQAAKDRGVELGRSALESLPCELKDMIAASCDAKTAINLALAGPVLYEVVKRDEVRLATTILKTQISPDLKRLIVALRSTEPSEWRHGINNEAQERLSMQVVVVTTLSFQSSMLGFGSDGIGYTLQEAVRYQKIYSTARHYAKILAEAALKHGPRSIEPDNTGAPAPPDYVTRVSAEELHRFTRALIILQLSCRIFPDDLPRPRPDGYVTHLYTLCRNFWSLFAPWEQQQVRCVQTMMMHHVKNALQSEEARGNLGEWLIRSSLLGFFVCRNGLPAIRDLERRGRLRRSLLDLDLRLMTTPQHLRQQAWFTENDEL